MDGKWWSRKVLGVVGLVMAIGISGCGRKFSSLANPKGGSNVADSGPEPSASPAPEVRLEDVSVSRQNMQIEDPAVMSDDFLSHRLVIREESFTNSNDSPVWVWIRPSVNGLQFWGMCSSDRAQYNSNVSDIELRLTGGRLVSKALIFGDWGAFEIDAHQTATVQWAAGGSWNWKSGPNAAPSVSCNDTNPQRGWAGFDVQGTVSEDARVTVPEVIEAQATGPANFLDSHQVSDLNDPGENLAQHWRDWP